MLDAPQRTRLAVVPARGGSKRLPGKNVKPFHGVPMLERTLRTLKHSHLFQVIHVSTDSPTVAQVAASAGYPPDQLRPASLSDDQTGLAEVIQYEARRMMESGADFDELWLILPCIPLITAADLQGAALALAQCPPEVAVLSVSEYPVPIEWAMRQNPDGELEWLTPDLAELPAAQRPSIVHDAGAFVGYQWDSAVCVVETGLNQRFRGHAIEWWRSVDVDTADDWIAAERLFTAMSDQYLGGKIEDR